MVVFIKLYFTHITITHHSNYLVQGSHWWHLTRLLRSTFDRGTFCGRRRFFIEPFVRGKFRMMCLRDSAFISWLNVSSIWCSSFITSSIEFWCFKPLVKNVAVSHRFNDSGKFSGSLFFLLLANFFENFLIYFY